MSTFNETFITIYHHHIIHEWKDNYLSYDGLKMIYKEIKKGNSGGLADMEAVFALEITRVDQFTKSIMLEIEVKLDEVKLQAQQLDAIQTSRRDIDNEDMTVEEKLVDRLIRTTYQECTSLLKFHELNLFAIAKTAKKFRKLCPKAEREREGDCWENYESFQRFRQSCRRTNEIKEYCERCINTYSSVFRKSYPELASGELTFDKDKQQQQKKIRIGLGMKIGIILTLVAWIVVTSNDSRNGATSVFSSPGLLVYTTIGNVLLYRLLWALNVWLWSRYHVNYIYLLNLDVTVPNSFRLLEEASTYFLLFIISLTIYFQVNATHPGDPLNNICPLFLLVCSIVSSLYPVLTRRRVVIDTAGNLFSREVWYRCFIAPFAPVQFRDVFSADVLTSFTKTISDAIYGACWVVSGSFLQWNENVHSFGSNHINCRSHNMALIVGTLVVIPFWIRFLQCSRDAVDKQKFFPFCVNAMKYLSTICVVIYGLMIGNSGWAYYSLVILTSIFKWIWDVVMDWDLFHPPKQCNSHVFLRPDMMYPDSSVYYAAIVLDLILRFVWVISLVGANSIAILNSNQLNFFFGSLEIMRRFMWGHFRMEFEHLKHMRRKAIGYVERRRSTAVKVHKSNSAKTLRSRSSSIKIRPITGEDIEMPAASSEVHASGGHKKEAGGSDIALYSPNRFSVGRHVSEYIPSNQLDVEDLE